jgi:exopolysaccharide production protein ExoZ
MRPVAAGEPLWDALLGTVIPAGALILGAVAFERWHGVWRSRFLQLLGDASYSIYLTHIFTLGIARALWMHTGMTQPTVFDAAVFAVFSMTLTILGSILVYRLVEQPITAALQRLHNRSRQSRAVTSGAAG